MGRTGSKTRGRSVEEAQLCPEASWKDDHERVTVVASFFNRCCQDERCCQLHKPLLPAISGNEMNWMGAIRALFSGHNRTYFYEQ